MHITLYGHAEDPLDILGTLKLVPSRLYLITILDEPSIQN